jgi:hypothetical protein
MIRESYRVPGKAASGRFVKRHPGQSWYIWAEQSRDDPRYDVAQGTCDAEDLPDAIRKACDEYTGAHYPCIWPFE